jgi:ActD protein
MSHLIATFTDEADLLAAVRAARAAGIAIDDAYTPYAVHGLDDAMGVRRSRLTWVCFLAGATGASLALAFQLWTSTVSWPLNVGGKPFASIPAFIPVTFELTVLSAALASAAAFLFRSRLFPGRRAVPVPRVTDDRFALVVADGEAARGLLRAAGAELHTELHAMNGGPS